MINTPVLRKIIAMMLLISFSTTLFPARGDASASPNGMATPVPSTTQAVTTEDDFQLSPLSQLGGQIGSVAVGDTFIAIATDNAVKLRKLDGTPFAVRQRIFSSRVLWMQALGNLLYVLTQTHFYRLDLSTPAAATLLSYALAFNQITTFVSAANVPATGWNSHFLPTPTGVLQLTDAADGDGFTATQVALGLQPSQLAIGLAAFYYAFGNQFGARVINSPDGGVVRLNVLPGTISAMAALQSILYAGFAGAGGAAVQVLDVSGQVPQVLSTINLTTKPIQMEVTPAAGTYPALLRVLLISGALVFYDLSNPAAPVLYREIPAGNGVTRGAFNAVANRLVLASLYNAWIYAGLVLPLIEVALFRSFEARDAAVIPRAFPLLVLALAQRALVAYDLSDPEDADEVGWWENLPVDPQFIYPISNTIVIVAGDDGFVFVDFTDPANPIISPRFAETGKLRGVAATLSTLILVRAVQNELAIWDIRNRQNPQRVGEVNTPGDAQNGVINTGNLFVADGAAGASQYTLRETNGPTVTLARTITPPLRGPSSFCSDVALIFPLLVLACGQNYIWFYQLNGQSIPTLTTFYALAAVRLAMIQFRVFGMGGGQLAMLDAFLFNPVLPWGRYGTADTRQLRSYQALQLLLVMRLYGGLMLFRPQETSSASPSLMIQAMLTLAAYSLLLDLNGDGQVNIADLALLILLATVRSDFAQEGGGGAKDTGALPPQGPGTAGAPG